MEYVKMKEIDSFKVEECKGVRYQKWNNATRKMETATEPTEGYRASYEFMIGPDTQLSSTEVEAGQMLTQSYRDGKADLLGKEFFVTHTTKTVQFSDGERDVVTNHIAANKQQQDNLI